MTLGSRIRHYREKAGLTLDELSTRCGVDVGTISALEVRNSSRSKYATAIAQGLGMTVEMLEDGSRDHDVAALLAKADNALHGEVSSSDVGEPIELKEFRRLPVVGEVKGGIDGYLEELEYPVGHGEGYINYPTCDPNAYALRVRGDSMHPRYRAGEFVVIEPGIEAQEGDDVVVSLSSGRKMLKEFRWRRDGEYQFTSVNNGYEPITIAAREILTIQLVGGRARRNALQLQ